MGDRPRTDGAPEGSAAGERIGVLSGAASTARGRTSTGTPGGARLRTLRERAGRTQLWVELEAELGTGYLQRLESGRVLQPERATVERILAALGARYGERREALELFGYLLPTPLPTEDDLAWAREASDRELGVVGFPAYVLDCAHRLVAWNVRFERLLGARDGDGAARALAGRSLLAPWFDRRTRLGAMVAEPGQFLPALIRAMRYERERYRAEPWYADVLTELMALPCFRETWARVEAEPPPASAARALVPVRLDVPGVGRLEFHLAAEPFTRDARFRLIYYFPADSATLRWCAAIEA